MSAARPIATVAPPRLEAASCGACGHLFLPRGPLCPRCWSSDLSTRELCGQGEVATFTVYRQQYHRDFPPPYVIALIALREGPRMISNVVGCAPESVRVGMPVRVRFEPRGERVLPLFEPDGAAAATTASFPGEDEGSTRPLTRRRGGAQAEEKYR
ncbi:MAG: OB-fold domain-containing protein [Burkholderiaceae bacterium]|nr:OB-fold domain-containing protein [Burkholderiaceae bacterium]